jgi:hypothetical protein
MGVIESHAAIVAGTRPESTFARHSVFVGACIEKVGAEHGPHPARLDGTRRWIAIRRLQGRSDPIRLARMVKQIVLSLVAKCSGSRSARGGWGLKRTTSRSLAFHRQFHPDELDGAEIPVANFFTHFLDARPLHWSFHETAGKLSSWGKLSQEEKEPLTKWWVAAGVSRLIRGLTPPPR